VLLIDGASRVLDRAWTALRPTIAASDGTIVLLARRAAVVSLRDTRHGLSRDGSVQGVGVQAVHFVDSSPV
jgi:hypothetical protein